MPFSDDLQPPPWATATTLHALPVSDHRIVFHLPFRLPVRTRTAGMADKAPAELMAQALEELTDHALLGRWERAEAPSALWKAQPRDKAVAALSPEFYPVVARILFGDPADPSTGHAPYAAIAQGGGRKTTRLAPDAYGAWLRDAPLHIEVPDGWLQIQLQSASVRLFGTGIGLFSLTLKLAHPDHADRAAPIPAGVLLKALHTLTQTDERGQRPLFTGPRLDWRPFAGQAREGMLFVEHPGGLREVQISGYQQLCMKAGGSPLPLWLCRAVRIGHPGAEPGAEGPPPMLLLERLAPEMLVVHAPAEGDSTAAIPKHARLVETIHNDSSAADSSWPAPRPATPSSQTALEPTHQALQSARPGEAFWAHRLPRDFSLIDLLRSFLPPQALPSRTAPSDDTLHWRAFSQVGVRVDGLAADEAQLDRCRELSFRLARRFDLSYRPHASEIVDAVVAPFDTVFHSVATQGAGLVIRHDGPAGPASGGTEFLQHFLSRGFVTAYRPLAEVCVHEYVHLMDLVQDSAFLPTPQPRPEDIARLQLLSEALSRYRLFYRFSKISHMAHHNTVLALWRRGLGLDVVASELAQDVNEAHRLLHSHQAQIESDRWRLASSVGLAMAAFLSVSEGMDRWAQATCPPEALAIAATDMQIHGSPAPLLELLQPLKSALRADEAAGWAPLLGRACAAPWQTGPAPTASAPWVTGHAALDRKLAEPVDKDKDGATWGQQLRMVCDATAEARACADVASRRRTQGLWASLGAAVVVLVLVFTLSPGGRGNAWFVARKRPARPA